MLRVQSFKAVRPLPNLASQIASVPYDVVNTAEALELSADNPLSFLHVVRAEIDLPTDTDPYDDEVYEASRDNLRAMLDNGVMIQDDEPGIFLYRQVMDGRIQTGVVCCCHIDDYQSDVIKKHEKTRKVKEDDRTRHVLELNANAEPVFLTYRDSAAIDDLVNADSMESPLYHFNAPDGVTHTVWRVKDPDAYINAFRDVPASYIADGHHRSASAARAGAELRDRNPNHTGDEEYNWFLTVQFPASQLQILAYNRVVSDLNGKTPQAIIEEFRGVGTVEDVNNEPIPTQPGSFCFYVDGTWRKLTIDPASIDHSDPINSLDVALLQDRVLTPVLGVGDIRSDKRIDFVGGIRGTDELAGRVDKGEAAIAFSMFPTSIEQLLTVADAGEVMPPKSTWFEPKLRSGLFVHMLE